MNGRGGKHCQHFAAGYPPPHRPNILQSNLKAGINFNANVVDQGLANRAGRLQQHQAVSKVHVAACHNFRVVGAVLIYKGSAATTAAVSVAASTAACDQTKKNVSDARNICPILDNKPE